MIWFCCCILLIPCAIYLCLFDGNIEKNLANLSLVENFCCCDEFVLNVYTLPGTNMEVDNGLLEDHFPLQAGCFPLPC